MFTFGNDDYAFYLTDISADNIAIDDYDKPKFVDLENIFILNKNSLATGKILISLFMRKTKWKKAFSN